jgi:hypothetical protein
MEVITAEAGEIKLGDTLLPGVFQSMQVSGKLRIDEKKVPGSSGKRKQPLGYEDAAVSLSLKLLTDEKSTCYEKAGELTRLFQNVDNKAKPYVYRIVNRHLSKWNIREVLFEELRLSEDNRTDVISASLNFAEYKPALVAAEAKAARPPAKSEVDYEAIMLAAEKTTNPGTSNPNYMGDFKKAEEAAGKEVPSPAVDDDLPGDW